MRLAAACLIVLACLPGAARAQSPAYLALAEGQRLLEQRSFDAAGERFARALALAREERNPEAEARARYGRGKVLLGQAQYPAARSELELALAWFQAAGAHLSTGRIHNDIGYTCWALGDRPAALAAYRRALVEFEAAGDERERASALYNLAFNTPPGPENEALVSLGLDAARRLGDRRLEGKLFHLVGDRRFADGDFAGAAEKLLRAADLFTSAGAQAELARVLTSLGRLYRTHGHADRALAFYRHALDVQRALGDRQGVLQSTDALGIVYQALGRHREARAEFVRALELARRTGSPSYLGRQLAHLAALCNATGRFKESVALLDEAARLQRAVTSIETSDLSWALLSLGRVDEALAAAEAAVARSGGGGPLDARADALCVRARVRARLGRRADAVADMEESLRLVEQLRARLVPTDFMKSGYGAQHRRLFSFTIEMLHAAGRHERAFEIAEQARGRAFLDLLATQELSFAESGAGRMADGPSGSAGGSDRAAGSSWSLPGLAAPDLRSVAATPSATVADAQETARRLGSTIVAYWVDTTAVSIWVLSPGQPVHGARVPIGRTRLVGLIRRTSDSLAGLRVVAGREGARIDGDAGSPNPWRELHGVLIRPVARWLPSAPGSLLTIVPHGPLFALPFAALCDSRGRYLVERYTLHSVPAVGVLQFTRTRRERVREGPASYLLVADPVHLAPSPDGRRLSRLPASRLEAADIARLAAPGRAVILAGARAVEDEVRAAAPGRTVLHFATHGLVFDDRPLDSFLALSAGGRLTAREIYGLGLRADLVVLSGCRTARGQVTGDGILGLTRAFFYAGTPSVVSTVWDVADEPAREAMSMFYRALARARDKARALRTAQLGVLRMLREGRFTVATALGRVALPERPVFWAGFVLQGEP